MIYKKIRRPLGRRSGLVLLALLALGIVVTLGSRNSSSPVRAESSTAAPDSPMTITRGDTSEYAFSGGRYLITIALLTIGGGIALYLRSRAGARTLQGEISLVERHQIRQGQELRLIQVGEERILLGVTANHINVLHTVRVMGGPARDERGGTDSSRQSRDSPVRANTEAGFAAAIAAARELIGPNKVPAPKPSKIPPPGVYPGRATIVGKVSMPESSSRPNGRQHV